MALRLTKKEVMFDLHRMDADGVTDLAIELRLDGELDDSDLYSPGESQEGRLETARDVLAGLIVENKLEDEFYDLVHGEE